MVSSFRYFYEDIDFKVPNPLKTKKWLQKVIHLEKRDFENISYIFCSDEYLHSLNTQFLGHNTLTDIITFDLSDSKLISGEIYISVDRVKENSQKLKTSFMDELNRVMVHGILHLLGYKDKKPKEKSVMRKKEDSYLSLR